MDLEFFDILIFIVGCLFLLTGILILFISFKMIIRGKWITEINRVVTRPVHVVRCSRIFGVLNSVILETSDSHRFQVAPHPCFDGSKIAEGDVGVAYTRKDWIGYSQLNALVGFRLAPTITHFAETEFFDVVLEEYNKELKIDCLREIRSLAHVGLQEAMQMIENMPTLFKEAVSIEEAKDIKIQLEMVGVTVSIKPHRFTDS